jgi:uroporphyrin-III C-methyltransferase / precorrin-2 dehydrogenase / sirohydrochlorin ferrochelatase
MPDVPPSREAEPGQPIGAAPLLPLFVKLAGRKVLVVGAGPMGTARVRQLAGAGARVRLVAPEISAEAEALAEEVHRRPFVAADLDGVWLAVAAASPGANGEVARAAEERRIFVNAVDDPERASAYTGGVVRRGGVVVAISTEGRAPALAGLLREAMEAFLPADLDRWVERAESLRADWKREGVRLEDRRPRLLELLVELYAAPTSPLDGGVRLTGYTSVK